MSEPHFTRTPVEALNPIDVKGILFLVFFLGILAYGLGDHKNEPADNPSAVKEPPPFTILDIGRGAFATRDGDICLVLDNGWHCTVGVGPKGAVAQ